MKANFAIPGDLATQTGGYVYARRVLRALPDLGCQTAHVILPEGFPDPDPAALKQTTTTLQSLPDGQPLLLDGLAGAVLPPELLATLPGPTVMLCHHPLALETGVSPENSARLHAVERQALGACQHVVTTSHATAAILIRDYGVNLDKLTVAPPGTDPAPRAPADGPSRILSVGSLTHRKRHDILIRSLAQHRDHEWTLQIVGPARDLAVKANLENMIVDLGLQDRVVLAGALPASKLAALYQNADLFALASEYEGFGMAYTEAMSHGLPTLGVECPAVAEATAGGALLVQATAFSDAIGKLLAEPDSRRKAADAAWRASQTFLRWPQTATIVADVLRKGVA